MRSRTALAATTLSGLALAACGSPQPTETASVRGPTIAVGTPLGTTTNAAGPSIVGEWQRLTTCEERVAALTKAGLGKYAAESVAGDGLIPGVTSARGLKDPAHPCVGAVPQKHSHFFTADGQFGSRDEQGQQVDDGPYELVDSRTVRIGGTDHAVEFHFTISDNKTLRLVPVMPACAPKGCFEATWAVAVSYLGLPWTRVG